VTSGLPLGATEAIGLTRRIQVSGRRRVNELLPLFWLHFGLPWGPPGRALGVHGGAKTRPEAEKGVFRRGLRKTLEKRSSLEGPKPEK